MNRATRTYPAHRNALPFYIPVTENGWFINKTNEQESVEALARSLFYAITILFSGVNGISGGKKYIVATDPFLL